MCKIDAAFAGISLNENPNFDERFEQALDESFINDSFKTLLIKHFAKNWRETLGEISSIERALAVTKSFEKDCEKLIAFLTSDALRYRLTHAVNRYHSETLINTFPPLLAFASDAAQKLCGNSPFCLYELDIGKRLGLGNMPFLSIAYGDNVFTESFFDAKSLKAIPPDARVDKLWRFFCAIVCPREHIYRVQPNELQLSDNDLCEIINEKANDGPPTKQTVRFLKGIKFLNAWIKFDAQSELMNALYEPIFNNINQMFYDLESISDRFEDDELKAQFHSWSKVQKENLELQYFTHADPINASRDKRHLWAEELEKHFNKTLLNRTQNGSFTHEYYHEHYFQEYFSYLDWLIAKLTPLKCEVWMQYNIAQYIKGSLENDMSSFRNQNKWLVGSHYQSWKILFLNSLKELNIEQQLKVLSNLAPIPDFPENVNDREKDAFLDGHLKWWSDLLYSLVSLDGFPKYLLPTWTIAVKNGRRASDIKSYIDNSIGFLRGALSKVNVSEAQSEFYQTQLTKLLGWMSEVEPHKALRHRLMLMRTSHVSLADEALNYRSGQAESLWYKPLKELCKDLFQLESRAKAELHLIAGLETFYVEFSKQIIEFCLSRLRLRKGEKTFDGHYNSNQIVEPSPAWRQGYLKALGEIGYDLNGQVHKTVNFVKQSDPDPDVRAIAKETYKIVRRQSSPTQTVDDLKRGIIAAEWWLLLCQRQELKLNINNEMAIQTRRKLLRNP